MKSFLFQFKFLKIVFFLLSFTLCGKCIATTSDKEKNIHNKEAIRYEQGSINVKISIN